MSLIVELSVFPMDKGASVSAFVARAVSVIRESGLPHLYRGRAASSFKSGAR